jgi:hypothetical protein
MSTRHLIGAVAALALAGTTAGAALSGADAATSDRAAPTVAVVAKHLAGPLSVAQAPDGTRYWTDDFAGMLFRQSPGGQPTVLYKSKHHGAEGVSADGGELRFTTGSDDNKSGGVWTFDKQGALQQIADTWAYEKANNPDGKFKYGFLRTPRSCIAQLSHDVPRPYTGHKETHAYATAVNHQVTYVADAGANDVLAISPSGAVSTVAVLKPVKVKVTTSIARSLHLPGCTVGKKFALEAVPTDIEVGPDGQLYVTSLPGGPEDPSLGLNGRVLRIDPATGKVTTVVAGLLSPTGVAVAGNGDLYVAQLFRGVISKVKAGHHKARTYLKVKLPAAVEVTPTGLLATIHALPGKKPKGQVVTIAP